MFPSFPSTRNLPPTFTPWSSLRDTGVTSGELFLFGIIHQIVLCKEDVMRAAGAVNLQRWYDRIAAHPTTREVLDGNSPMGNMAQYFINPP